MKKLSKFLLCLTLMFVSCFAMVGCGDNPPETPETPPETLSFSECFGFSELTTYSGGLNCTSLSDLSQYGYYKSISLYAKQDISFNHIGFKINSENDSEDEIYITIKFDSLSNWNSTSTYQIKSEKTNIDCFYVKGSSSGSKYFIDNVSNPNLTKTEYSITKDTVLTIYFGTEEGYQNYPAYGEFSNSFSITDFIIE